MGVLQSNYPDLFDLRIAADNYFADAFTAYPMPFLSYWDVKSSVKQYEKVSQLGGITPPNVVGESGDFPVVTPTEGYDVTGTPLKYAQTIPISYEARSDDPKGIYTNLNAVTNMHYRAMHQKACTLAADFLNLGFASTGLAPDGQFLFDTDHPTSPSVATTLSNLITTKLDAAGLAVAEMFTKISTNGKDLAGNQILYGRFKLVVPPALHSNALKSCVALYGTPFNISNVGAFQGVVGGTSAPTPVQTGAIFTTSTTTGQSVQVVVDPFLGAGYTNGSDVKWYMIADPAESTGFHSLRWIWREEPQIVNVSIDQDNLDLKVPGLMRCVGMTIDFRHLWASNGTV